MSEPWILVTLDQLAELRADPAWEETPRPKQETNKQRIEEAMALARAALASGAMGIWRGSVFNTARGPGKSSGWSWFGETPAEYAALRGWKRIPRKLKKRIFGAR